MQGKAVQPQKVRGEDPDEETHQNARTEGDQEQERRRCSKGCDPCLPPRQVGTVVSGIMAGREVTGNGWCFCTERDSREPKC